MTLKGHERVTSEWFMDIFCDLGLTKKNPVIIRFTGL